MKRRLGRTRLRRAAFEQLEPRLVLDASLLRITEFMASNRDTLLDADGDDSDWIEIYNSGSQSVDLSGLYLTDDADNLTHWSFPPGNVLEPGAFRVVFASSKDTVLAGNELHTDFNLGAGGEYLALVDADGTTVIDEFAPGYPAQQTDLSYGPAMQLAGPSTIRLTEATSARGLVPSNASLGDSWSDLHFDDSSWPYAGVTGFGYEDNPGDSTNFSDEIATYVPSGTTSLYLRVPFTLTSLSQVGSLRLEMRYDDGFVAYLNGVQIASANAPDTFAYNAVAAASHSDTLAEQFVGFDASAGIPHLRPGANVLAIHALNLQNSSDMLIEPRLVSQPSLISGPERTGFFTAPTPGHGNGNEIIQGFVAEPAISLPHGFYDTAQSVAITSATSGATVVYTTDGSTPTVDSSLNVTNGTLYQSPLTVASTTTLRAAAFFPEFEPSPVQTQTYIFVNDVIHQQPSGQAPGPGWPGSDVNGQYINYGMDPEILLSYGSQAVADSLKSLTTVSITTDLDNLFDPDDGIYVNANFRGRDWERSASLEMIYPDGSEPGFQINAGLRIRGGYSRNDFNPKHAFRFYFRSEYGAAKLEYPIFGEEGVDRFDVLDLRTAQNYAWSSSGDDENTFVREVFGRDLQRELGQPYTRSLYHHLYVNGVYWGVFMTQERVEKHYGQSYLGGDDDDYDVVKADIGVTGMTEVSDGDDTAWRQLFDFAQDLAHDPLGYADNYFTMQGRYPDGTRNPALPVLLDVDNLIDYMTILFYTGANDSGLSRYLGNNKGNNWFGIRNRVSNDHGFQFFVHDNEHSLGSGGTDNTDRTGPFNEGNQDNYAQSNPQYLHQDLLASPEYRLAFADRVRNYFFDDGPMTPNASRALMQTRVDQVDPAIIAESARWGDAKREPPRTRSDWLHEINTLQDPTNGYFTFRTNDVLDQVREGQLYPDVAAPQFNQYGGVVPLGFQLTMSGSGGVIVFTTDGSDPRLIGGSTNPSAQSYQNPVVLASPTTIKARVFHSPTSTWSALTSATFTTQIAGDYDLSGLVDQADYELWVQTFGSTTNLAADGSGNGIVDAADFTIWRDNLGSGLEPPPRFVVTATGLAEGSSTTTAISTMSGRIHTSRLAEANTPPFGGDWVGLRQQYLEEPGAINANRLDATFRSMVRQEVRRLVDGHHDLPASSADNAKAREQQIDSLFASLECGL